MQLLDAENNIIDNEFLGSSLQYYVNYRNKGYRTRSQTLKGLTFSYNIINSADEKMSSTEACDEPMDYEYNGDELSDLRETSKQSTPIPTVIVWFQNCATHDDSFQFECVQTEILQSILHKFVVKSHKDLKDFSFFKEDNEPLKESEKIQTLEVLMADDKDYVKILFEYVAIESSTTRSLSFVAAADDLKTMNLHCLVFVDLLQQDNDLDLQFKGTDSMLSAIEQLVSVMDLNRSNVLFFAADGECVGKRKKV